MRGIIKKKDKKTPPNAIIDNLMYRMSPLSFSRASLLENSSHLRTDNVREQISVHTFAPCRTYLFIYRTLVPKISQLKT